MNTKIVKKGLGRGLSALISSPVSVSKKAAPQAGDVLYVDIEKINNNPNQPRQDFDAEELKELADSITNHGLIQPILVKHTSGGYEIIAGERRWRAAKLANMPQLPVIIKDLSDKDAAEIALIENIQRADLNPVELAIAYQKLMDEHRLTQVQLADRLGKERTSVANTLRILKLAPEVLALVRSNKLSLGHAKALLAVKEPSAQRSLAKRVIEEGISVRSLESVVARVVVVPQRAKNNSDTTKSDLPEVQSRLRAALGTKVQIKHKAKGVGLISISYFSEQELERILDTICP